MKVSVKYACGHIGDTQVYGGWKERERYINYLSRQVCPECKRQKEAEEAKKLELEFGLPDLEGGSEKQRAWAVSIRAEWLRRMAAAAERYEGKADIVRAALVEAASTKKSAIWWIDNRVNINAALAAEYEEALKKRGVTE